MALWGDLTDGAWTGAALPTWYGERIKHQTGISPIVIILFDCLQVNCALHLLNQYALASNSVRLLTNATRLKVLAYSIPVISRAVLTLSVWRHKKGDTKGRVYEWTKAFDRKIGTALQLIGLGSSIGLAFHNKKLLGLSAAFFISHDILHRNAGAPVIKQLKLGKLAHKSAGVVQMASWISANTGRLLSGNWKNWPLAILEVAAEVANLVRPKQEDPPVWEGKLATVTDKDWVDAGSQSFKLSRKHAVYIPPVYPKMDMEDVDFNALLSRFKRLLTENGKEYDTQLMVRIEAEDEIAGSYPTRSDKWNCAKKGLEELIDRIKQDGKLIYRNAIDWGLNDAASNLGAFVVDKLVRLKRGDVHEDTLVDCILELGVAGHLCGDAMETRLRQVNARLEIKDDQEVTDPQIAAKRLFEQVDKRLEMLRELCMGEIIPTIKFPGFGWFLADQDLHTGEWWKYVLAPFFGITPSQLVRKGRKSALRMAEEWYFSKTIGPQAKQLFWPKYTTQRVTKWMYDFFNSDKKARRWLGDWFDASYAGTDEGKRELWGKIRVAKIVKESSESEEDKAKREARLAGVRSFIGPITNLTRDLRGEKYLRDDTAKETVTKLKESIQKLKEKADSRTEITKEIRLLIRGNKLVKIRDAIVTAKEQYRNDYLLLGQLRDMEETLNSESGTKLQILGAQITRLQEQAKHLSAMTARIRKGIKAYSKRRDDEEKNGTTFGEIREAIADVWERTSADTKTKIENLGETLGDKPCPGIQMHKTLTVLQCDVAKLPKEWRARLETSIRRFLASRPENQPTDFSEIHAAIKALSPKRREQTKQLEESLGKEKVPGAEIDEVLLVLNKRIRELPEDLQPSLEKAMGAFKKKRKEMQGRSTAFTEIKGEITAILADIAAITPHRKAIDALKGRLALCKVSDLKARLKEIKTAIEAFPDYCREGLADGVQNFERDFTEITAAITQVRDEINQKAKQYAPPGRIKERVIDYISEQGVRLFLWKFSNGAIIRPSAARGSQGPR